MGALRKLAVFLLPLAGFGQNPQPSEFFESKIRPILANQCLACHNTKLKTAGLDFSSRVGITQSGERLMAAVGYDKGMGYGIAFVTAIIVIFILMMLTKRAGGASPESGTNHPGASGVTPEEPASDQPTPQAGRTVNRISIEATKKIPPG